MSERDAMKVELAATAAYRKAKADGKSSTEAFTVAMDKARELTGTVKGTWDVAMAAQKTVEG